MADVFNKEPVEFVDLNELFPVLNSAVGLTHEQFRILVENTFWLKNQEEIGVVKAFIVSGSSEFGALWLSETDGGAPLVPNPEYIYIVQTNGNFKNKIFSWNGSIYEQLAKDSDNNYTNADKSKVDKLITNGDGTKYLANDGVYKTISGGGGIPEAPSDGHQYVRKDASWVKSSRIQSDDNFSYFEAGGNVYNKNDLSSPGYSTIFQQSNSRFILEATSDDLTRAATLDVGSNYLVKVTILGGGAGDGTTNTYLFAEATSTSSNKVAKLQDIPKVVFATDVVVAVEDWVADTTYTGYGYKADLTLTGMLATYEPSVVFDLTEVESGNYASVCLAGENTITIYAKEIPSASITIPLIKGEEL